MTYLHRLLAKTVAEAIPTTLPGGVHAPVAHIGHLIAPKLLASDEMQRLAP